MLDTDHKIIFITGASRSGTTLMSFILRNNSQVFGLKETHYFGEFWDPRKQKMHFREQQLVSGAAAILARHEQGILSAKPTRNDFDKASNLVEGLPADSHNPAGVFANVTMHLAREAGKALPCEQTPRNIFYADSLLNIYPNARIVHMMRDPRAVIASQKKRWQRRRLTADNAGHPLTNSLRVWINYHPYTAAKLWNRASQAALRLESNPRFTLVRFEDLLEHPYSVVRSLCNDLNIDYEQSMLNVGQINSSHQSSICGARKGLNKDAIDTWKTSLTDTEIVIAERLCSQLMKQYEYTPRNRAKHSRYKELPFILSYILHVLGVFIVNPRRAWIQFQAMSESMRIQSLFSKMPSAHKAKAGDRTDKGAQ